MTPNCPDTLSRKDADWKPVSQPDLIKLGSLKPASKGIQSCKLVCFNTPFCRSYEYLMYDDSCNFFSDKSTDDYYKGLIDRLKNSSASTSFTFNLIHLLQADLLNMIEEKVNRCRGSQCLGSNLIGWTIKEFANITLVDQKRYPSCQPSVNNSDPDELKCSDQLADFTNPYVLNDLIPLTNYQFRVEVVTPFGISRAYLTESVQVPFELRPIEVVSTTDTSYSLKCSTTFLDLSRFKFVWFKNEQILSENENSTYEIVPPRTFPDSSIRRPISSRSNFTKVISPK